MARRDAPEAGDIAETRLIVHGSDERMTEKADHLQKLIDFKKDNSPPKE